MNIVMERKEMNRLKNDLKKNKLLEKFDLSDIINLYNMGRNDLENQISLKNSAELEEEFENTNTLRIFARIYKIVYKERTLKIKGADSDLEFIISKFDTEKLKKYKDKTESILAEVTLRKHERNKILVENITPWEDFDKKNYEEILKLRKDMSTEEWKNLILQSIGYDLSESKGILKDLMLVRLLPYLEKNYSYTELGGYSTGKTSVADLFSNSEKISSRIEVPQLYFNIKTKEKGILLKNDVLYFDESNFREQSEEVKTILLQALAGNQIQARDISGGKSTDVSIVFQENIENGIQKYMEKSIFGELQKIKDFGAYLDRNNFFIAGWLIPTYEKTKVKDEQQVIPLNILEDFFKIQRNKDSYTNKLEGLKINLITRNHNIGRFKERIMKTISGFLKLLYPGNEIDLENEKEELEKIIVLSILGKYSIFNITTSDDDNVKIEVSYKGVQKITIDKMILLRDYIRARENNYFEETVEKQQTEDEKFSTYKAKWLNENTENLNEDELWKKYKMENMNIDKRYEDLLDKLRSKEIKDKYITCFKTIMAYSIKEYEGKIISDEKKLELETEQKEYIYSLFLIMILFETFANFKLSKSEKDFITEFMEHFISEENEDLYGLTLDQDNRLVLSGTSLFRSLSSGVPNYMACNPIEGTKLNRKKDAIRKKISQNRSNEIDVEIIKKFIAEKQILESDSYFIEKDIQNPKNPGELYLTKTKSQVTKRKSKEELFMNN